MTNEPGTTTIADSLDSPFSVEFRWKNIKSTITLENGEDLIRLSQIFSEFLSSNGIQNKLDITSEHL